MTRERCLTTTEAKPNDSFSEEFGKAMIYSLALHTNATERFI